MHWAPNQPAVPKPLIKRLGYTVWEMDLAPIKTESARERRRFIRYSLASQLKGRDLLLRPPKEGQRVVQGQIQNISAGGLCLLINRPAKASYVLRCGFPVPGIPVLIPTLMQVRWTRQAPAKHRYLIGLQFLI